MAHTRPTARRNPVSLPPARGGVLLPVLRCTHLYPNYHSGVQRQPERLQDVAVWMMATATTGRGFAFGTAD